MMRKRLLIALMLTAACAFAKDKPPSEPVIVPDPNSAVEPNVILQEIAEVERMVLELPAKEKALKEKIYTEITADQFYQERFSDVNEVYVHAAALHEKAEKASKDIGLAADKNKVIQAVLIYKKKTFEEQKRNVDILRAINEFVTDPNGLPEPTDPNYLEESSRRRDLLADIMEICDPK